MVPCFLLPNLQMKPTYPKATVLNSDSYHFVAYYLLRSDLRRPDAAIAIHLLLMMKNFYLLPHTITKHQDFLLLVVLVVEEEDDGETGQGS